ncbi:hypothetical protein MNBD_NITROSPIRAE01-346 [hydrothermal vent metagenome]|uniref:Uncharacterized protein n=1 Tax=hydrothermal vent metagenome TaxID=652676 RepID=A0A3B1DUA0_9ZZZZ
MQVQQRVSKEDKSRAVANLVGQKKNNMRQILGFVDNRQETASLNTLQRKIHSGINAPGDMNLSAMNGLLQRKVDPWSSCGLKLSFHRYLKIS